MGYSVIGNVIDSAKQPVMFATVYTSDASGKPVQNAKTAQTDEKGNWKIDGLVDTDYITIKSLGFKPYTFLAKSVIPTVVVGSLLHLTKSTLTSDSGTQLAEIEVVAKGGKPKYGIYILIGVGLILTTVLIAVSSHGAKAKIK